MSIYILVVYHFLTYTTVHKITLREQTNVSIDMNSLELSIGSAYVCFALLIECTVAELYFSTLAGFYFCTSGNHGKHSVNTIL